MKIILESNQLLESKEAHEYLQEKLGLPEYYGGNLDALYDCLMEMSEDIQLIVRVQEVDADRIYLKKLLHVMKDAEEENQFLSIFVEKV